MLALFFFFPAFSFIWGGLDNVSSPWMCSACAPYRYSSLPLPPSGESSFLWWAMENHLKGSFDSISFSLSCFYFFLILLHFAVSYWFLTLSTPTLSLAVSPTPFSPGFGSFIFYEVLSLLFCLFVSLLDLSLSKINTLEFMQLKPRHPFTWIFLDILLCVGLYSTFSENTLVLILFERGETGHTRSLIKEIWWLRT